MKRASLLAVMGLLVSMHVTASDAERDAHMIERAEAWFEKFQAATPEQQARMLERRNACLQVLKHSVAMCVDVVRGMAKTKARHLRRTPQTHKNTRALHSKSALLIF